MPIFRELVMAISISYVILGLVFALLVLHVRSGGTSVTTTPSSHQTVTEPASFGPYNQPRTDDIDSDFMPSPTENDSIMDTGVTAPPTPQTVPPLLQNLRRLASSNPQSRCVSGTCLPKMRTNWIGIMFDQEHCARTTAPDTCRLQEGRLVCTSLIDDTMAKMIRLAQLYGVVISPRLVDRGTILGMHVDFVILRSELTKIESLLFYEDLNSIMHEVSSTETAINQPIITFLESIGFNKAVINRKIGNLPDTTFYHFLYALKVTSPVKVKRTIQTDRGLLRRTIKRHWIYRLVSKYAALFGNLTGNPDKRTARMAGRLSHWAELARHKNNATNED